MDEYSKFQIIKSFHFLNDHPDHLFEMDITDLRYLLQHLSYCMMGVEVGIENLMALATLNPDGQLIKEPDYYPDEVLEYWTGMIEKEILSRRKASPKTAKGMPDAGYSHKSIKIAYFILGIPLTQAESKKALDKFSSYKSVDKLRQYKVIKNSLASLQKGKAANTKHLKALEGAERLISSKKITKDGEKISQALAEIRLYIANFKKEISKIE